MSGSTCTILEVFETSRKNVYVSILHPSNTGKDVNIPIFPPSNTYTTELSFQSGSPLASLTTAVLNFVPPRPNITENLCLPETETTNTIL